MKKVTKAEIKRNTKSVKGKGFAPSYIFKADIAGMYFETMWDTTLIVSKIVNGETENTVIGEAEHKADFINAVYDYLNL